MIVKGVEEFKDDFQKSLFEIPDEKFEMEVQKAINILKLLLKDIDENKNIILVGDNDPDGVFSTIQFKIYLDLMKIRLNSQSQIDTFYTTRKMGYELPKQFYYNFKESYNRIVFLDTGGDYSYNIGNSLVIDHHPVNKEDKPNIVNPNINGSQSTSTGRIIYEMISRYERHLKDIFGIKENKNVLYYAKMLASITLVSDMAKITYETANFIKEGLDLLDINKKNFAWIGMLKEKYGNDISTKDLSFNIINFLNSYSRLNKSPKDYEKLFLLKVNDSEILYNSSSDKHKKIISALIKNHNERKFVVSEIEKNTKNNITETNNLVLLEIKNNEFQGLNGLIAQNLLNIYSKPSFVFSFDEDRQEYIGSARGKNSKNILKNFDYKEGLKFGGHEMAFGFSFPKEYKESFIEQLQNSIIEEKLEVKEEINIYTGSLKDFIEAKEFYNIKQPTIELDEKFYFIISDYKNLGIVEKNNGWFFSALHDEKNLITVYFKEDDIKTIKSEKPFILEIDNRDPKDVNFIIHKSNENLYFQGILKEKQEINSINTEMENTFLNLEGR